MQFYGTHFLSSVMCEDGFSQSMPLAFQWMPTFHGTVVNANKEMLIENGDGHDRFTN